MGNLPIDVCVNLVNLELLLLWDELRRDELWVRSLRELGGGGAGCVGWSCPRGRVATT